MPWSLLGDHTKDHQLSMCTLWKSAIEMSTFTAVRILRWPAAPHYSHRDSRIAVLLLAVMLSRCRHIHVGLVSQHLAMHPARAQSKFKTKRQLHGAVQSGWTYVFQARAADAPFY